MKTISYTKALLLIFLSLPVQASEEDFFDFTSGILTSSFEVVGGSSLILIRQKKLGGALLVKGLGDLSVIVNNDLSGVRPNNGARSALGEISGFTAEKLGYDRKRAQYAGDMADVPVSFTLGVNGVISSLRYAKEIPHLVSGGKAMQVESTYIGQTSGAVTTIVKPLYDLKAQKPE